jgi:hypothetical protein
MLLAFNSLVTSASSALEKVLVQIILAMQKKCKGVQMQRMSHKPYMFPADSAKLFFLRPGSSTGCEARTFSLLAKAYRQRAKRAARLQKRVAAWKRRALGVLGFLRAAQPGAERYGAWQVQSAVHAQFCGSNVSAVSAGAASVWCWPLSGGYAYSFGPKYGTGACHSVGIVLGHNLTTPYEEFSFCFDELNMRRLEM